MSQVTSELLMRVTPVAREVSQRIGDAWALRTRAEFADAIRAVADLRPQGIDLNEREMSVLCAVAYHQPIDRARLAEIFGAPVNRDLIARLRVNDLITTGPRAPRQGAPQTFVTTHTFLATFGLESLRDLPELGV